MKPSEMPTITSDRVTDPAHVYLTISGVAELFQLHEKTVARLARTGVLPTKLVGRSVRFRLDEVDAAITIAGRANSGR